MIATLFAQEFRSSRKSLFTTAGVLLLVAVVSFALGALRVPVLGVLGIVLGFIAVIAIVPVSLVLLAVQYWRTMYGREGYFTMTLPVRGRSIYWSKVLYALLVVAIGLVVSAVGLVAGIVVILLTQGAATLGEAFGMLGDGLEALGAGMAWFIVVSLVVQLVYTVIAGSALMSIGARGRFNHMGFAAPVVGAVILYFVMQVVGLAAMLFIPIGLRIDGPDAGTIVARGMWDDFVLSLQHSSGTQAPAVVGLGIFLVSAVASVVLAWAAVRSIERHTSLR